MSDREQPAIHPVSFKLGQLETSVNALTVEQKRASREIASFRAELAAIKEIADRQEINLETMTKSLEAFAPVATEVAIRKGQASAIAVVVSVATSMGVFAFGDRIRQWFGG